MLYDDGPSSHDRGPRPPAAPATGGYDDDDDDAVDDDVVDDDREEAGLRQGQSVERRVTAWHLDHDASGADRDPELPENHVPCVPHGATKT